MKILTALCAVGVALAMTSGCSAPAGRADPAPSVNGNANAGQAAGDHEPPRPIPSAPADSIATIVTANDSTIEIWDEPAGEVVSMVDAADVLTVPDETPLVFLVESRQADWFHVYLPVRPNGATGWVRASQVTESGTPFAIDVYLASHELVLSEAGEEVARYPVGVGTSDKPTPGGVYYLRELLVPPDPDDIYGPYAYGLSGFSPVLDSFRGGDAVIGLHGTNEPESIGTDVSHGCLRLANDDITALVETYGLPLGTPVRIHE